MIGPAATTLADVLLTGVIGWLFFSILVSGITLLILILRRRGLL